MFEMRKYFINGLILRTRLIWFSAKTSNANVQIMRQRILLLSEKSA
jgi:hypothetical protein